jgi:hypothetical protein
MDRDGTIKLLSAIVADLPGACPAPRVSTLHPWR